MKKWVLQHNHLFVNKTIMNKLKPTNRVGGLWRMLVIFIIGGYTLSTVLAFDGRQTPQESKLPQKITTETPLRTQIEDGLASGVKNIWKNLVSFMQEGLEAQEEKSWSLTKDLTPSPEDNPQQNETPLLRMPHSTSESALLPAFQDISNDPNKASIEILAAMGLVQGGGQGKYHPGNHVRCSDFVRVLVDLKRQLQGLPLDSSEGLTDQQLLTLKNPESLLAKKLNTAKQLGMLEGLNLIRDQPIQPAQVQQILNNTLLLHPHLGQKEKVGLIDTTKSVRTKSEMAKDLVAIFQLDEKPKETVFRDIDHHPYQEAITQLAQLGVVAGRNGNFYPDQKVLRSDGVIMIANSRLAKEQKALVIKNFYHLNTLTDVTYFATYAPHLEYLLEHEIWTSLLHHELSGNRFLPDAVLTQWEAYQLITQAAGIKILNPHAGTTSQPITRGELAYLLVEAFDFQPKEAPKALSTAHNDEQLPSWEAKKSFLVSLLKEVVNEL